VTQTPPPAERRHATLNRGLLAAGAAVAILAGTIGLASADSGSSTSAPAGGQGGIPVQYGDPAAPPAQDGEAPAGPDGLPCPDGATGHHGGGGGGVPGPNGAPSDGGTAPQATPEVPATPSGTSAVPKSRRRGGCALIWSRGLSRGTPEMPA
jgi:hypothetical protein